jgi:hypothetical protein
MDLFISWSGKKSQEVALALKEWLPFVLNDVVPFLSSEDLHPGKRWSTDLSRQLEKTDFGVLCLTKENVNAPWINFEAGALSKKVEISQVVPLLLDVKGSELPDGPILIFTYVYLDKEGVKKVVTDLNDAINRPLEKGRLETSFEKWWPELEDRLNAIKDKFSKATAVEDEFTMESAVRRNNEMLEEILELARNQEKRVNLPVVYEASLPAKAPDFYWDKSQRFLPAINLESGKFEWPDKPISYVSTDALQNSVMVDKRKIANLEETWNNLEKLLDSIKSNNTITVKKLLKCIKPLRNAIEWLINPLARFNNLY